MHPYWIFTQCRRLFVEPNIFHAPAVEDAVDHGRPPLDIGLPAGRAAVVKNDRPGAVLGQLALDLSHKLLALLGVGLDRLPIDQLVHLGTAIAVIVHQDCVLLHQARILALRHRVAEPDFRRLRGRDQVADPERPSADLQPNSFIRQTAFRPKRVRNGLTAGGRWIRTSGSARDKGSVPRFRLAPELMATDRSRR